MREAWAYLDCSLQGTEEFVDLVRILEESYRHIFVRIWGWISEAAMEVFLELLQDFETRFRERLQKLIKLLRHYHAYLTMKNNFLEL